MRPRSSPLPPTAAVSAPEGGPWALQRGQKRRAMHPSNKYAENPPDFNLLAAKYPSFGEYVVVNNNNKRPRIDWTDFNATRELTRVLLDHDYGIKWWIPDGQLCPTVPNRANYIHWIADLLASSSTTAPSPRHNSENSAQIRGFDIGTGANCIYPLLGAAIHGWHYVASDVTAIALEWAQKNLQNNPQFLEHIEVRKAERKRPERAAAASSEDNRTQHEVVKCSTMSVTSAHNINAGQSQEDDRLCRISFAGQTGEEQVDRKGEGSAVRDETKSTVGDHNLDRSDPSSKFHGFAIESSYHESLEGMPPDQEVAEAEYGDGGGDDDGDAPLLVGVVGEAESFDFCMCNPPFFENMEEAGLNPRTACGGTPREMVYPGGELAFITRIVKDSLQLRNRIQWYTSMVGRKINIKTLTSMLRSSGVTMLRTTEFVQGRTSRWGIAWSFSAVQQQRQHVALVPGRGLGKSNISFMLEALAEQLRLYGATIAVDTYSFSITGTVPAEQGTPNETPNVRNRDEGDCVVAAMAPNLANEEGPTWSFKASAFQQVPGTLLIKASLSKTSEGGSGAFSSLMERAEMALKRQFLKPTTGS